MNALHTMLVAANVQAQPVIGSLFTLNGVPRVPIIVSEVDEKIAMEMEGYLSDAQYIGVISTGDFSTSPVENTLVVGPDGSQYVIRGVKSDQSSWTIALHKYSV